MRPEPTRLTPPACPDGGLMLCAPGREGGGAGKQRRRQCRPGVCLLLLAGVLVLFSTALSGPAAAQPVGCEAMFVWPGGVRHSCPVSVGEARRAASLPETPDAQKRSAAARQATPAVPTPVPTLTPTQTVTEFLDVDEPYRKLVEGLEQFGLPGLLGMLGLGAAFAFVSALAKKSGESLVDYVYRVFLGRKLEQRIARIEADATRQEATREADQAHTQAITAYLHWLQDELKYLPIIPVKSGSAQELPLQEVYVPLRVVERDRMEGFRKLTLGDFDPQGEYHLRREAFEHLETSQPVYRLLSDPEVLPRSEEEEEEAAAAAAPAFTTTRLLLVGDAGSGKTTLLHFGALVLAHDYLRDSHEQTREELELYCARPLLPFYIRLTLVANYIRDRYDRAHPDDLPRLQGAPATLLLEWLDSYTQEQVGKKDHPVPTDLPSRAVAQGHCLLLLDGLDETGDAAQRDYIQRLIINLQQDYRNNRYLVASRPFEDLQLPGFAERHLSPMNSDEMQRLLRNWFSAVRKNDTAVRQVRESVEDQVAYLWGMLDKNARLFEMATNPLLLTTMALLVQTGVGLPRERAELYNRLVALLLETWRILQVTGGLPRQRDQRAQLYGGEENVSGVQRRLHTLAAWMQAHERREIRLPEAQEQLRATYQQLMGWHTERCDDYICRLLESLALESGLVQRRDRGYSFAHFTLQEYLTARDYDQRAGGVTELFEKRALPRWREVILLAVGHWVTSGDAPDKARQLLQRFIESYDADNDSDALLLAGAALDDADADRVLELAPLRTQVVERLRTLAFTRPSLAMNRRATDPRLRNQAATLLDRLNADMRDALNLEHPDYWARRIEPGPFIMGDDNGKYNDEKPAFTCHIHRPYALARFPVTNRQYKQFLDALARQGKDEEVQQRRPRSWPGARYRAGEGNHPVVGVSWEDGCAFAAWVNDLLHARGELGAGEEVRLPTEPEWERAAAYPVQLPADQPGAGKRVYPWGDGWDEAESETSRPASLTATADDSIISSVRANVYEGDERIGGTSVVGIFPHGAADCGAEELAGNVWEWCSTPYQSYPLPDEITADTIYNSTEYHNRRYVLRGGSWDRRFVPRALCEARRLQARPRARRCRCSPCPFVLLTLVSL